ncbi:Rne/Rng family ribonuclease [Oryzobacter telluris]|uniref:Rne/Rng family ribonuclease n=1 Tax=Oryzobacter telluris TaxID=3149179 RepID=UPI00370DC88B
MASENDPTTPDTDATPTPEGVDAEQAPTKPKRRRATKKTSAPAPAADEAAPDAAAPDTAATPAADEAPAADAAEPAAKKAPRKRAAKKTTRKKADVAAELGAEPSDEPLADLVLLPEGDEPLSADLVPLPEADDEDADDASVPSFGLLFQPPQPVSRPRRRATAPVQAPVERPADEVEADDAPSSSATSEPEAASSDAGQDDTADSRSDDTDGEGGRGRRRRGGRGRRGRGAGDDDARDPRDSRPAAGAAKDSGSDDDSDDDAPGTGPADQDDAGESGSSRRRRRRRRGAGSDGDNEDPPGTVTRVREPRPQRDEPTAVKGSTRLEAKKQRRREGREAGRRRTIITEAEFLARRESVERVMVVRGRGDRTQIGVLEDGVMVEHYVSRETTASMAGNVYLGRVQNVLPSMEAAFVDIGKGRNAVLYAGEVNWDAAGLEGGHARRIENALSSGDTVLVQVTKDPMGHKGARLTSQISLPGRYLVYVPEGQMTGISRKLPDTERARLKAILKEVVPDHAGVIVRTAAEGASEEELRADVDRLTKAWDKIAKKAEAAKAKKAGSGGAPVLLHGEPDLTVRVIRDVFTEDFTSLVVSGDTAWDEVSQYVEDVAPDLAPRLQRWTAEEDVFAAHRIDEALAKAMDRKVWLPSGGSLVIDRTEAMTVVDVNTGKFVGSGGNLEETVTKNNLEAAEEIVRQLRLRDIGGIIVIDFIDMVLESNRDLVVRRLLECLGRDRTKHQVAEVTSLGLVQMTRKRVGSGLVEVFSEQCEHCGGRGILVHSEPVERGGSSSSDQGSSRSGRGRGRSGSGSGSSSSGGSGSGSSGSVSNGANGGGERAEEHKHSGPSAAQIAAAAHAAALRKADGEHHDEHHDEPAGTDAAPADVQTLDLDVAAQAVADVDEAMSPATPAQAEVTVDEVVLEQAPEPVTEEVAAPAETVEETEVEATPEVEEPAARAPRGRRRRGRVVAPAGPPRSGAADGAPEAPGQ